MAEGPEPDLPEASCSSVLEENSSESDLEIYSADEDTSDHSSFSASSSTLLNSLRSPTQSELARKRKIRSNHPPVSVRRRINQGKSVHEPKSVSPGVRMSQFPNELLIVSNGILFCSACREPVSLKKSIIKLHIESQKHKTHKLKVTSKEAKQRSIAESLRKYDESNHPSGEMLSEPIRIYRIRVVKSFLKAGIPLSKVDRLRDLLEENAVSLTGRQHLSEYIPFIHGNEVEEIKKEIRDKSVSMIFDGTTHLDEAIAIVLRFIDNMEIKKRLVCLKLLSKSLTGEELARVIISVLSTSYSIESSRLIASMRDRASVNNAAMDVVKLLYPGVVDIGCFSHTLDRVGQQFKIPVAEKFSQLWVSLFSRSPKARLAWRLFCDRPVPTYSETRWWRSQ